MVPSASSSSSSSSRRLFKAASNALGQIFAVADDSNRVWLVEKCTSFEFIATGKDVRRLALSEELICAVSEAARVSVHRRTAEGWTLEYILEDLRDPLGLTWHANDLFVADSRRVLVFSGRSLCCSLESKQLRRASDVALLPTADRPPAWWLGHKSHETTVTLMRDCGVGEWRVRADENERLKLCYVSKAAWRRADVDEKPIVAANDGFVVEIKAEVAKRYFEAKGESSDHVPPGIGEFHIKVKHLWTALRLFSESLQLKNSFGHFEGRSRVMLAVASRGTDRVILFEYARQVDNLFSSKYRYAGERRGLRSPTNLRFSSNGDLVVALSEADTSPSISDGRIVTLCKPSYHRISPSNPPGVVDKDTLESLKFCRATSDHLLLVSSSLPARILSSKSLTTSTQKCGSFFDCCLKEWLEGLADYLGFAETAGTIASACRALRGLFVDLRRSWRISPLTPAGLERAKRLFTIWARQQNLDAPASRHRRRQRNDQSNLEGADRLRYALNCATQDDCAAYALHARKAKKSSVRQESEDDVSYSPSLFLDFGRGLFACVSSVYGSKFWWHWRGVIAQHFASLATEKKLSRSRYVLCRDRKTFSTHLADATHVLDVDSFVELWTRLELHVRGLRPWQCKLPRDFAQSDGAMIAVGQTDDEPVKIERALQLGTKALKQADDRVRLAAYLDVVDYFTRQSRYMIHQATRQEIEGK